MSRERNKEITLKRRKGLLKQMFKNRWSFLQKLGHKLAITHYKNRTNTFNEYLLTYQLTTFCNTVQTTTIHSDCAMHIHYFKNSYVKKYVLTISYKFEANYC